jgi:hypothetical protein
VLDLDSPQPARFDARMRPGSSVIAARLAAACDWRLAGIDGYA